MHEVLCETLRRLVERQLPLRLGMDGLCDLGSGEEHYTHDDKMANCQLLLVADGLHLLMALPALLFFRRASCALCSKHVSSMGFDADAINPDALRASNWHSVGQGNLMTPVEGLGVWIRCRLLEAAAIVCCVAAVAPAAAVATGAVPATSHGNAVSRAQFVDTIVTPCAWLSCALCLCTQDIRTVRKGKLLLQLWCLLQLIVSGIRVYSAVETCEDRVDGAETDRCERQWQAGLIASICSAFAAAVSTLALCAAPRQDPRPSAGLSQPLLARQSPAPASEAPPSNKSWFPEDHASLPSLLFFWWVLPLLRKGHRGGRLDPEDLPTPPACDQVGPIFERFTAAWGAELRKETPSLWRALHSLIWRRFYFQIVPTSLITIGSIGIPVSMK